MFCFAVFILPPMYDVLCDLTGLNGKVRSASTTPEVIVESGEKIEVQFLASIDAGMPWAFEPTTKSVTVHPGAITKVSFYAKNNTQKMITGQAIPSIAPAHATQYFKKTACFCFDRQTLMAGEDIEMSLIFFIDPEIPKDVKEITLSYRLYNMNEPQKINQSQTNARVTQL